jgi:hypothetical protein
MRPVQVGIGASPLGRQDVESPSARVLARAILSGVGSAAKASTVNRTHRVIRERARAMQADRKRRRSLVLPLVLCSVLMGLMYAALWLVVEQYEAVSPESPTESHHLFMLLLWFLPVSVALGAMVWYRRSRNQSDTEAGQ